MTHYRRFFYWLLVSLVLFIGANLFIWERYTEKVLAVAGGDLARLGYIPWAKHLRENVTDLPRLHIEQEDYTGQPVRIVTFGDSFSNGGGGGRNSYYQDYMATVNNCNVLNIEPFQDLDFLTTVSILASNGYLDSIRPKYFLLSSSEKSCIERFIRNVAFSRSMRMEELLRYKRMGFKAAQNPNVHVKGLSFVNSGNYRFLLYSLLYHFSNRAYFSKVYQLDLSTPFFSNDHPTKLLFYKDDVSMIPLSRQETVAKVNDNLNLLSDLLMKKGIKLYFMPCVDKYDLYSDYIVNNKFPKNQFFEEMRKLPRRYVLIDSKAILTQELRKGEKDVFHADDTHWTWKASRKIFETVRFP